MKFYRALLWSLYSLVLFSTAALASEVEAEVETELASKPSEATDASEAAKPGPIAMTKQGKYEGLEIDGVNSFLGIPFAASTAGVNRWQEPAPLPAHEGVEQATAIGPACLQTNAKRATSEDCLSLNVWTPDLDGAKRPVMVWIHGGGLRAGSNDIPGQVLANSTQQENPAVVVAINYRLGPLGFLSHRSLKTKHANFGLLDMVAALEWVQANIADFGGDPNNVTIFGVSAGGMAVNMLMTSPLSEGLFHKAIAQSGYGTWPLAHTRHAKRPPALNLDGAYQNSAERQGADLVKPIIGRKQSRKKLLALPGQQLVDVLHGFQLPFVDGQSLKAEPGIRFLQNKQHKVPYITGGVSNEGSVIGLRKLYERDFFRDDNAGWSRVFGDTRYLLSARVLGESMAAKQPDTWLYYIDFIPESFKSKWIGTPHGMDGWLLFNGQASDEPDIKDLTGQLHSYWLNFAHTGNPNSTSGAETPEDGAQPLPPWPAYSADDKQWLVLSANTKAKPDVIGPKLDVLTRRYQLRIAPAVSRR